MSSLEKRDRKKYQRMSREYRSRTKMVIDPNNYACPCCGKTMEYISEEEMYGYTDNLHKYSYIICRDCDIRGKVKQKNGFSFLASTPVKRDTRILRCEAHYFFDKLYEFGIFPDRNATYKWLTQCFGRDFGSQASQYHIGEMDSDKLKATIKISIEKLAEHPEKCTKVIEPYKAQGGSYSSTNEQLSEMLKKLDESICGALA